MKYYRMEPQTKKSVVEFQYWTRTVDGEDFRLEREQGWRWGAFLIAVPETDEEIADYCKMHEYDIEEFPDLELLPDPEDDLIDIEYYNAQMIETSDGCWQQWRVTSHQEHDEEQAEELAEEAEAAWDEDWDTGVEQLGWTEVDSVTYFEIHGGVEVTRCDEMGSAL